MRIDFTVADGGELLDVRLEAPATALMRDVAGCLHMALGKQSRSGATSLFVGGERVDDETLLGDAGLRDGAVVGLSSPTSSDGATKELATLRLSVIAGPDAGAVFPLTGTQAVIGRRPPADIVLRDTAISRRHISLQIGPDGVSVEDLGSTNGSTLDDAALPPGPHPWPPHSTLRIGTTSLSWSGIGMTRAHLEPAPDGGLAYNRPPRLAPPVTRPRIEFPSAPPAGDRTGLSMATIVAPVALGVVMALVLKRPEYLLFTLLSPLLAVSTYVSERRKGSRSHRSRVAVYEQNLAAARSQLTAALTTEETRRREAHPDPIGTLQTATIPTQRLWERRLSDDDALTLRIGVRDLPAEIEVSGLGSGAEEKPVVRAVPVTVGLRESGVLGVAGPREAVDGLGQWLVAQAATWHSPRDLSIVILCPQGRGATWSWSRWLPHLRPTDGQSCVALVGNDDGSIAARVAELVTTVVSRGQARNAGSQRGTARFGDTIVVLDGARALRSVPGMSEVLREGPAVGVHAICLEETEVALPEECQAVVTLPSAPPDRGRLRRAHGDTIAEVIVDSLEPAGVEQLARALAPLRDISREDAGGRLPDSVRLLDLLELEPPTQEAIAARWAAGGHLTQAVIGMAADGPFVLDIRRDGPHGLVAGTTGSGKSELLQTVIASLAVANRPDALNFVLVDYKGGTAFRSCALLPHTVGLVTDLDGHETERALASLEAELKRREVLLNSAGVKDIEDYARAQGSIEASRSMRPLPRLVVVVDEFASLVAEQPEFISGLVGVARRGRALGVHMVLATQRPAGVVSPEIRANTDMRISLRVTDPGESSDVLDAPDAARIPRSVPGRAYIRLGPGSLGAFQAARVGGLRPGATHAVASPTVVKLPWQQLGYPAPSHPEPSSDKETTDLSVLVQAICDATNDMGIKRMRSPWLPPLPTLVTLDTLPRTIVGDGAQIPALPFALEDLPEQQDVRPITLDLERGGHMLIAGSPRSGRSTVLRTLAGVIGRHTSSRDVHMYCLDCGNGALLPISELPHCGAVVTKDQVDRLDRLMARLQLEIVRRHRLLVESGCADLVSCLGDSC